MVKRSKGKLMNGLLAGPTRLELATSGVTGRRSNQAELRPRLMSAHYRPIAAD